MPSSKHRDDQLFMGRVTIHEQAAAPGSKSGGGGVDLALVPEAELTFDRVRHVRHVRITLTNLVVAVTAALDYGSEKICDLPDSNILILGAEANISLDKDGTGILTATDVTAGIGTAAASNATLSGAMIDVLTQALTVDEDPTTFDMHTNALASPAVVFSDDAATLALYLNAAATIIGDGSLTANGTIDLFYIDTGNVTS